MFFLIYKISNQIDGKIYIGSHKTKNLNDNYMGSGKYLKRAIEKYGIINFKKEILFIFDNPEEMYAKEAELVNENFLTTENTYNLKIGGFGGWDHVNDSSNIHIERCKKARQNRKKYSAGGFIDKEFAKKCSEKGKIKQKEKYPNGTFHGKKHTQESKKQMSMSSLGKHDGEKNSQFGTKWIYSLILKQNKKIKKDDNVPEGWFAGRKNKF
jgi:hypothetical protein